MGRNRTDVADVRRFLVLVVGFGVLFTGIGRAYGPEIAMKLQETPTTTQGWLFIGWSLAAPPYLLTLMTWSSRRRLSVKQRRDRSYLLAAWIGAGTLIAPSRIDGIDAQFGTGALVGEPLSTGWAWGMLATVLGLAFTGAVLLVLYRSVPAGPTDAQRALTLRFLERAWLVLLLVSLGFALYGADTGLFNGGT